MSELKADKTFVFGEECEAYKKSEADKVIAEKDAEIEELEERIGELQKATDSAWGKVNAMYDEILHHKYKRCLAMVKWCEDKIDTIKNGYMVSSINTQRGVMTTCPPECNPKFSFYSRWHNRWLELYEKFKEAK